MKGILASLALVSTALLLFLYFIGKTTRPWDGKFVYEDRPNCYSKGNLLGAVIDGTVSYSPYFNATASKDCMDYNEPLSNRGQSKGTQCGLTHYRTGKSNLKTLNWVHGPDHKGNGYKGANWFALSNLEKSGLAMALFILEKPGTLRDPHRHSNAAEFTYIIKGTARVTVTGVPTSDMDGNYDQSNTVDETFTIGPGDAFFSPIGYHHYYETVDPKNRLEGITIFDNGGVKTVDTQQMMKSIPPEKLQEILGLSEEDVKSMYRGFRRVFVDPHDTWSSIGSETEEGGLFFPDSRNYEFKISGMHKNLTDLPRSDVTGVVKTKTIDKKSYPPLSNSRFSFSYMEIQPNATLEPYWIDNADEIVYVIEGKEIEVIRSSDGYKECRDEFLIEKGFFALSEVGTSWLMKNKGAETAKFLRIFNSNRPTRSTLYDAYYSLPMDVVHTMTRPQYFEQFAQYKDESNEKK